MSALPALALSPFHCRCRTLYLPSDARRLSCQDCGSPLVEGERALAPAPAAPASRAERLQDLAARCADNAERRQIEERPADVRQAALPEPATDLAPNAERATSSLAETSGLEDLARRMAKSINNAGEARALAGRVPGLTAEERARVFGRWAELRGVPLKQPAPSTASTPSPAAPATPSKPPAPQGSVNIPAPLIGALGAVDLHVLVAFLVYARRSPTFTAPLDAIEELTKIPRRTLLRAVDRLEGAGYVTRERSAGQVNTYTVTVAKAPQFIRVPVGLLGALDSEALAQYLALRAICGRFDTCARSVAELAARAGLSVRAARQALARLQEAGLLAIRRHLYRESTYRVLSGVVPNLTGGRDRSGRGSCQI
jgi:DNA-binding MarR family transcriptional regulator